MPGKDRLLLAGHPHHLVRKSQGNEPIFLDEADIEELYILLRVGTPVRIRK